MSGEFGKQFFLPVCVGKKKFYKEFWALKDIFLKSVPPSKKELKQYGTIWIYERGICEISHICMAISLVVFGFVLFSVLHASESFQRRGGDDGEPRLV